MVRSNSAAAAPEKLLGCWEAEIYDLATNSNCDDDEISGDTFLPKVEPCTISFVVDLLFFQEQFFLRYTLIWRNLPLSIFQLSLSAFFQNTNWTHRSQVSSVLIAYPPLSVDKSAYFSTIMPFQQPTLAAKYEIWIFNGTI